MRFPYRLDLLFIFFAMAVNGSSAATIKIGLFHNLKVETIVFSTVEGEYMLNGDGEQIAAIRKGNMLYITLSKSGMEVQDTKHTYGSFSKIGLKGVSKTNVFQVKPVYPSLSPKESEDDLTIEVNKGFLIMINSLDLEKYIPGTVEAEGGSGALPEYYKAQAIISRTFAIKNFARHAHEGFNICDGVHCQAFNGKSRMNKDIYTAVNQTIGVVLVDDSGQAVVTAYHSNCGGITSSAATEWNRDLQYLTPVSDPFCNQSKYRTWTVKIPLSKWTAYLVQKGFTGNPQQLYTGDTGRRKYLVAQSRELPLTEIRKDFGLKSSYFHITHEDGSAVIKGHGYGHGLGLCQQGAMEMAKSGYTYVDILMFYFRGLKLDRGSP